MLFARLQTLVVALMLVPAVNAANYLDLSFSSSTSLEDYFYCESSTASVYSMGYAHINDVTEPWFVLRGSQFNYEVATCTSIIGDSSRKASLTSSQSFLIDSENYVLRWDARSGLYKVPESFYVSVLTDPLDDGSDHSSSGKPSLQTREYVLLEVNNQDHHTKTYALSLKDFQGERVRISFVATTTQGWLLLLDNIFLGEATKELYTSTNATPYHCPLDGSGCISIKGTVTSLGLQASENLMELYVDGQLSSTLKMDNMPIGKETPWEFLLPCQMDQAIKYSVRINGVEITSGSAIASTFSKRIFTDHFTGTWCNNCPESMIEVIALEEKYGNEMMTVNTHLGANDFLAQSDYTSYFEIYAIPQFYFDHLPGPYTLNKDYVPATFYDTPIAGINLWASRDQLNQKVNFKVQTIFSEDTDNSTDRYRIGLMLLGDFYDPADGLLAQSNMQPTLQKGGVLHYTRDGYILPKVEWHFDVPYNAAYGFEGLKGSLDKNIKGMNSMEMEMSLDIPDYLERYLKYAGSPLEGSVLAAGYPISAVAMVIDTETNQILNCAKVYLPLGEEKTLAAQTNFDYPNVTANLEVDNDFQSEETRYFNLSGIRVKNPTTPGIYLKRTQNSTSKVVVR